MAAEKVRERLLRSTSALDRHNVPYAVIGGNAVAAWVSRVDADAVRNTVDVDILLYRMDLPRATTALAEVGFDPAEVFGVTMFIERDDPSPRRGIHVIFAGEQIREHDPVPAPDLSRVDRTSDGYAVIELVPLLTMKLIANRRKDQVHIADMLELEMITPELESQLPAALRERLDAIRAKPE